MRLLYSGCLILLLLFAGCGGSSSGGSGSNSGSVHSGAPYDTNVSVPKGDPNFPALGKSWIIDKVGVLSQATVQENDAVCQRLQDDKIAEVVVVIIRGVKQPDLWATHYGRWLKLGSKGYSTEGGNNGVVWLIRPEAQEKMTISVGRGLPEFTTVDYGKIMDDAKDYINFGNFDKGVGIIVAETDQTLRKIKVKRGAK
jgi:hypothetical protein